MKKYFIILISILFFQTIQAQNLNASLSFARFYNPELGPYVETYLAVESAGVRLVPLENGNYQAHVNLLLMFKRNDSIIEFSKTQIHSPEIEDTLNLNFSFIDQQRFFLANGNYTLEIEFQDANAQKEASKASVDLELNFGKQDVQISDVEFLSSYEKSTEWKINTKNGFDMVPHVSSFFPSNEKKLTYYAEIYNTARAFGNYEKFLLTTYISNLNDNKVLNNLITRRKMQSEEVNVILNQYDLSSLASGNYYLNVEIRDKANNMVCANKTYFQLSNPDVLFNQDLLAKIEDSQSFLDSFEGDTLNQLVKCIYPIALPTERSFIQNSLKTATDIQKKKFLLYFWQNKDPQNPELAWQKYQVEVIKTQHSFGSRNNPGYATDRGRVYLQYGPPNTISDQEYESGGGLHEGAVPYEIWHYYEIGKQRNGKFVFYNPHLIPNGHTLLHSNVIGEVSNPHWQTYLHRNQLESIDAPEDDRYGGRSGEFYNDPR